MAGSQAFGNNVPPSTLDCLGKVLYRWRNERVRKEIEPPLLDVACGLNVLARSVGGIGVDIMNYGPQTADVIVKDFSVLPFEDGSFKTVTIVASLNYFDNPGEVFRECSRVLSGDGRLIVTMLHPTIGRIWHLGREPWAKSGGISYTRMIEYAAQSGLKLKFRVRFMFGMNNLYRFNPG